MHNRNSIFAETVDSPGTGSVSWLNARAFLPGDRFGRDDCYDGDDDARLPTAQPVTQEELLRSRDQA